MRGLCMVVLVCAILAASRGVSSAEPLGPEVRQLIVATAPGWSDHRGFLHRFERDSEGRWVLQGKAPIAVLFGKNGLGWGIGARPNPVVKGEPVKREGDRRAPTGVFAIGTVYGYAAGLPKGAQGFPYRQVSKWDAWIDDPKHPQYNRHVVVDPANVPAWFSKEKMRHGDDAYRWLVEVRHNSDPPVPGAGSAIFMHVRRGENRATHGCTTMTRANLEALLRWLRPDASPHFVLLPEPVYPRVQAAWGLPPLPN